MEQAEEIKKQQTRNGRSSVAKKCVVTLQILSSFSGSFVESNKVVEFNGIHRNIVNILIFKKILAKRSLL